MGENSTHVVWIDYTRIIACAMMVFAHCCDPFVSQFDAHYSQLLTGATIGSAMRACVPLFAMLSAVLLLPVEIPMEKFYKNRLNRIIAPLIIWSIVTPILYFLYINNVSTNSPLIDPASFSADNTINKILFFPINFNYDTTPLWYLYMLIGLYMVMPIISDWLKNAAKKTLQVSLYIWAITLVLPYIKLIGPFIGYQGVWGDFGILGECAWNPYGTFYYFSGFLGYAVLAFYLNKFPPKWDLKKTLAVGIPMWLVGFCITLGGFLYIQSFYPDDYQFLEICWYFCSINVAMMTTALYLIFKKIKWRPSQFAKYLASLTFGIYLSHFIVVQAGYDIFHNIGIPYYVEIALIGIFAFVVTTIIVAIIKLIPKSKYIIG